MAGFLGRLFGTEKALAAVVDGVSNGLDKLVFTDEEKADAAAKDRSEARQMVVGWMQATQGQNLARRLIALSITGVWLGQYLLAQFVSFIAIFISDKDYTERLSNAASLMRTGASDMDNAVMLILAFYFAAPHMTNIANAVSDRFTKKTVTG